MMDSLDMDFGRAVEAHRDGRIAQAEAACRELLRSAPRHVPTLLLMGTILHQTGRYLEAVPPLALAVELQPQSLGARSRLGSVYYALGDYARAVETYTKCIALDPSCAAAFYQLGNAYYALKESEKAAALFCQALTFEPQNHKFWNNLGNCFRDLGRLPESLAAYERALEIDPKSALTHWNQALSLLAAGRIEEGFQEYEWRLGPLQCREYSQPVWRGEPIPGKTLLLLAEHGQGDMILFARFAALARPRAGRVILECHAPLKDLFAEANLADAVTVLGEPLPPFDYYVPLMSLPALFRTTAETIPGRPAYLPTPPGDDLPLAPSHHLKVGLVWSGNSQFDDNGRRSVRLEELLPFLKIPGLTFYSLQLLVPPEDETLLGALSQVVDLRQRLTSFRDTASVLGQVDLVLTVDTAVANLAGAVGKPTFLLLQHAPDWRWLLQGASTPWYPSMRLFRQPTRGDWSSAIRAASKQLRQFRKTAQALAP